MRNRPSPAALLILVASMAAHASSAAPPEPVEPSELIRHPELNGREIVVDDRVRYFLESRRGKGYDGLLLKRTDVSFRLPPRLRFPRSPSEPNARVRGVLKVEDGRWACDVTAIDLLPADLDRVEAEIGRLRADDFQGRQAWALWAQRRGKELNEPKLVARGETLEGDALLIEAGRPETDALALAERSSDRPIPPAIRNALAHQGFRKRFGQVASAPEIDALAGKIEALLPGSVDPKASETPISTWLEAYNRDPLAGYREAPEAVRLALDRRLLADAVEKSLERQVADTPGDAARLADIASARLPDRPGVADALRQRGLGDAETRVAMMRQSEVEELARKFRDQKQDERARRLLQSWLDDRRKNRLSATDAEGRVLLAGSYDKLLGDRAVAGELLREAVAIDPESKTAVDAFLRLGFRKGETGWFDPNASRGEPSAPAPPGRDPGSPAARTDPGDSLRGLTRAQVRSRLGGKPDLVVRSATQGRCVEQWIYRNGKGSQVVHFQIEAGTAEPRATGYYSDKK